MSTPPPDPSKPVVLAASTYPNSGGTYAMTQANAGPQVVSPELPGEAKIDPAYMKALQDLVRAGKSIKPTSGEYARAPVDHSSVYRPGPGVTGVPTPAAEPMVTLYREQIGNGYGPLTTRQYGMNSVAAGQVPASQAAQYAPAGESKQVGDFLDEATVYADKQHTAWKAANPGEGPYSGSKA